jgi:hypothetical protein
MRTHPIPHTLRALALLATLTAASSAGLCAPALADPAQQAETQFTRGKALYAQGKKREAYEALTAAWTLRKSYDIAANLGSAELSLGKVRDAAEHFAYCIRTFPATGSKKQLAAVKQLFEDTRRKVGALVIKVGVEGAEVLVDGKAIGRAPLADEVYLDPGLHTVEAKLAGYDAAKQAVQAATGPAQEVTLALVATAALPPPAPPAPVAGGAEAPSPPAASAASAASAPPPQPPVEAGGPSTAVLISGGAVAGVALVAGAVLAGLSNGKASDAAAKRDALVTAGGPATCGTAAPAAGCAPLAAVLSDRAKLADGSLWSFVGAGAVAAGTVIYALVAPRSAGKTGARAAPVVTAGGGGVVVVGSF